MKIVLHKIYQIFTLYLQKFPCRKVLILKEFLVDTEIKVFAYNSIGLEIFLPFLILEIFYKQEYGKKIQTFGFFEHSWGLFFSI